MPLEGGGSVVHGIACLGDGFGDSNEIRTKGSYCVPPSTTAPVPCLIPILLPQSVLLETLPTSAFIKLGFLLLNLDTCKSSLLEAVVWLPCLQPGGRGPLRWLLTHPSDRHPTRTSGDALWGCHGLWGAG